MIVSLFRRRRPVPDIDALYGTIMAAALRPALYARLGVPDTFEGRFEAATVQMALVLQRLKSLPSPADQVAQALVDRFFEGLDVAIRQRGVGDTAVPRRITAFAKGFYGRLAAYEAAFAPEAAPEALPEAISRNLLEGAAPASALLAGLRETRAALAAASLDRLLAAAPDLYPAPTDGEGS